MALIELQAVERRFRLGDSEVMALDGVSLCIEAGEYVAIVGQSGSGKSTLLNILGCLDQPSAGHYRLAGQDTRDLHADALAALRRQHFGFVFQRYQLLGHLDACGNVALPAIYAGEATSSRLERARRLLDRLGLGDRQHHRPGELSGGQQQRVSIARALMNGGQIILADEPTGALDSASGAEMLRLLAELNAQGHTILLVTHDPGVAAQAHRVLTMRDGRLVEDTGTPAHHTPSATQTVVQRPGSRWQQAFDPWREASRTAWAALRANLLRSGLSILGISIGIAAVVSIVVLTGAAQQSIESDAASLMSGQLTIWRDHRNLPEGAVAQLFRISDMEELQSLPGVLSVKPDRFLFTTVRMDHESSHLLISSAGSEGLETRRFRLTEGRYFSPLEMENNAQVAVIGRRARDALFDKETSAIGQTVMVVLSAQIPSSDTEPSRASTPPPPAFIEFPVTVVGVMEDKPSILGRGRYSGELVVPDTTFARKLDSRTEFDGLQLRLDPKTETKQLVKQIRHRLRALHNAEDFVIWNSDKEFRTYTRITSTLAALFGGTAGIALLVGGVGVMNIMLVSVSERTREIGIRMAVGARQADVLRQFLVEAVLVCCLGGAVGVVLSGIATLVFNHSQPYFKAYLSGWALLVALLVSCGVGLLFGTLPARRAASLHPVDALARE